MSNIHTPDSSADQVLVQQMQNIAKWTRVMSITLMSLFGLLILGSIVTGTANDFFNAPVAVIFYIAIIPIIGGYYIFYQLLQLSKAYKKLSEEPNEQHFEEMVYQQHNFWQALGYLFVLATLMQMFNYIINILNASTMFLMSNS